MLDKNQEKNINKIRRRIWVKRLTALIRGKSSVADESIVSEELIEVYTDFAALVLYEIGKCWVPTPLTAKRLSKFVLNHPQIPIKTKNDQVWGVVFDQLPTQHPDIFRCGVKKVVWLDLTPTNIDYYQELQFRLYERRSILVSEIYDYYLRWSSGGLEQYQVLWA